MHTFISYKDRPSPKFDAIEDIKVWLGYERWEDLSLIMARVTNPSQFQFAASLAGIEGFPVEAWYDLYHGEGAYNKAWDALEVGDSNA